MARRRVENVYPAQTITVTTYDDVRRHVQRFPKSEQHHLMLLFGKGGIGKSEITQRSFGDRAKLITGVSTPKGLYGELYKYRDEEIVILDDLPDNVFFDPHTQALLKAAANTKKRRTLQWSSQRTQDAHKAGAVPDRYVFKPKLVLLANRWNSKDDSMAAIETRAGRTVLFQPSNAEIHEYVGDNAIIRDQEVFDFFHANLGHFKNLQIRDYTRASDLKKAGDEDWREIMLETSIATAAEIALAKVLNDPTLKKTTERATAFAKLSGITDRQYYRYRNAYEAAQVGQRVARNPKLKAAAEALKKLAESEEVEEHDEE